MKSVHSLIAVILLILFTGCQYDPYADNATTKRPKFTDVVGTYVFEQQSVQDSTDVAWKAAVIQLKADGTFECQNVPDLVNDGQAMHDKAGSISTNGKWTIETIASVEKWSGAKQQWGVVLTALPQSLQTICFIGNTPPYKLIINYDDPDLGQVMIFKRK